MRETRGKRRLVMTAAASAIAPASIKRTPAKRNSDGKHPVADLDAGDRTAPERAADEGERSYAPCARERVARGVGVNIARAGVECG